MFKKLAKMIAAIETTVEFDEACGAIEQAFNREKITWSDHEILFSLLRLIDREALPDIKIHGFKGV